MASSSWLLLLAVVLIIQISGAQAFGAGNIPSYSYLEGKAFRHGDIEDILSEIAKGSGGAAGLLGAMTGGLLTKKFGGLDVKRIYFGNWLRDYSQAMDVAGLSKLSRQAIINLVMLLGFLAHGYATGEFEVTEERLGVYLPTEHIDNPKDYNENQDARTVHPKLRGPVDPQELEIDHQTGMLNYIANEHGHWDTSKALIRRTLLACIDMGRRARGGQGSAAEYEAYRLLGSALHTLEDFSAHSNYCELTLRKLGYNNVFCHVGENVLIQSPNGQRVPPLVTGTFGGADFIHSLLGEAGDHISSASVSDLQKAVDDAKNSPSDRGVDNMRDLLFQLPGGEGQNLSREMDGVSNLRASTKDPMDMTPQELHAVAWQVMTFRDNVAKAISNTIEKIPGLGSLIDKLGESLARFVFVTLDPYLKPIMKQATAALSQGSAQVVNNHDQYKVFNDPNDMHPTHSFISKDHFNVILNEPAGMIAQLVVRHAVEDVVKAWGNTSIDAHQVVENILPILHHPYFSRGHPVQNEMEQCMRKWIDNEDKNYVIPALTKDSVRNHKNHRKGHPTEEPQGPGGYTSFLPAPASVGHQASGYVQQQLNHVPGYQQFHNTFPNAFGSREMGDQSGGGQHGGQSFDQSNSGQYGGQSNDPHQTYTGEPVISYGGDSSSGGYNSNQQGYGHDQQSYGGGNAYGQQNDPYAQHGNQGYGQQQGAFDQNNAYGNQQYGGQQYQSGYGNNDPYQQQLGQGRW